jgi:hypothetical protein
MMWCFHRWVEIGRTLTPGLELRSEHMEYRGPSGGGSILDRMLEQYHDHTSILLRCSKCGDIRNRIVRGDFT